MTPIIVQDALLNVSPQQAFALFSEDQKLENWLTAKARVTPEVGGLYELFWEPDDPENNSTIGCRVLAVKAPFYISFEWKGPKQFRHFMNAADPLTMVTVVFSPEGDQTRVTLLHSGWRQSPEWQGARQYFVNAWKGAFATLMTIYP